MADDIAQQLETCKQKYHQTLSEMEQQDAYKELLQRSLGRLALAAEGLDPNLDRQLQSLRNVLRKKSGPNEIKHILEKMEKAIAHMASHNTKDIPTPGTILTKLLSSLSFTKPVKPKAKQLIKKLKSASDTTVSKLLPEVIELLESHLNDASSRQAASDNFISRLFGFGKHTESSTSEETTTDITPEPECAPHIILMQLLERLSLPTQLSKKATQIRLQIEHGIDDEALPKVISDIADIVSSLGTQVITEKQEYEAFLQSLTSRLNELDQHIRQTSNDETKAFEQRKEISQAVEDEVSGLRTHVNKANDLEQLKFSINTRLDTLNQHFEKYRQSDAERYEQSQIQIQQLNERLKEMEQESQTLHKSVEQTREMALKDALTTIWNRQALNETLEKEYTRWLRYQKPLSLVIWDIDFFKRVNDEYGHAAGDKVLKTIARIFMQATRDADFIARYGGEEFVGLFPETRLEDALVLANKIREKIASSRFHYENKPVPITASAGLATFRPNDTIEDVFKRADNALYRSKSEGRNRCTAID